MAKTTVKKCSYCGGKLHQFSDTMWGCDSCKRQFEFPTSDFAPTPRQNVFPIGPITGLPIVPGGPPRTPTDEDGNPLFPDECDE